MSRKIVIASCATCPGLTNKGTASTPAYLPMCHKAHKWLPYVDAFSPKGLRVAHPTFAIPDWCPLPKD